MAAVKYPLLMSMLIVSYSLVFVLGTFSIGLRLVSYQSVFVLYLVMMGSIAVGIKLAEDFRPKMMSSPPLNKYIYLYLIDTNAPKWLS